ncbi:MAG TPA: CocE/NonD family hydrolase [Stellaceae bacterium]|nr:CocE/NonD family hydrolase [Stellaceae bacterium]
MTSEIRDGMRIDWDVPIPVDDGLVLRADVFRPVAQGRYPVILSYGPYGKGLAFQEGYKTAWDLMVGRYPDVPRGSSNKYQNWEVVDPEKWVPDGYACVRVDSRGAGRTQGLMDPFQPRETLDFYHAIEWAAAQPWSSGKIGLNGISYYAINQWMVAGLEPPNLSAICIWEGAADHYREMSRHGGILCTFAINWFDMQVKTVQHGYGERGPRNPVTGELACGPETLSDAQLAGNRVDLGGDMRRHVLDDEYYRGRSAQWEKITVPMLSAGNWGGQGLHLRGNIEGFFRAASPRKWLEMHGGEHWTSFYTDYGVALQKRFFGHFLQGEDTGWEKQPPLQLNIRHPGEKFVLRHENEWPLARTHWTRLYLDPGDRSLGRARFESRSTIAFEAMGEGVTFLTPPLEAETEITGPVAAKLWVSSSTTDADLFLVLRVFAPDGEEVVFQGALDPHTPVAQGWLRASQRKLDPELSLPHRPYHPHDESQPLTPGAMVELDIEIWPTSIVVPKGYRLALSVLGRDYEHEGPAAQLSNMKHPMRGCGPFVHNDPADRPPAIFAGTTTLHFGPDRQPYLLLPVVPPK